MSKCRDCYQYIGDCGHHFKDWNGHINYEIPSEGMFDGVIGDTPRCFRPSEEYLDSIKEEYAKDIAKKYSIEVIKRALEIANEKINDGDSSRHAN